MRVDHAHASVNVLLSVVLWPVNDIFAIVNRTEGSAGIRFSFDALVVVLYSVGKASNRSTLNELREINLEPGIFKEPLAEDLLRVNFLRLGGGKNQQIEGEGN